MKDAFQCNICSEIIIKNTTNHLRNTHEFNITNGQTNRGKDVRKALKTNYFTSVRIEIK